MTKPKIQDISCISAEPLHDLTKGGKERPWREKKTLSELTSYAYRGWNDIKAARISQCGKVLTFRVYPDESKKLHSMASCRVRLCPLCAWRRSLKVFHTVRQIVEDINSRNNFRYLFLTLTVKNCTGDKLSQTLDQLFQGWNAFLRISAIAGISKGCYRGLEVTHDVEPVITSDMYYGNPERHMKPRKKYYDSLGLQVGDDNPNFDTYHPHFHVLMAVNPSYFTSRDYLSLDQWAAYWKQALQVDYTPSVSVRAIKDGGSMEDINRALLEVAKYSVKANDYLIPDDWGLTVSTMQSLDAALHRRRMVAYTGIFRTTKARLKLDDEDSGSLVNVGEPEEITEEEYILVTYYWYSSYRQYYEIEP